VNDIIEQLGLTNVKGIHLRVEECKQKFDFILSRAVAKITTLREWSYPLIKRKSQQALPNGLITLKGGDLKAELRALPKKSYYEKVAILDYFKEPYFEEKFLVYLQL
jgi:16S rRNA (guanine527-N7)-methyltransferase